MHMHADIVLRLVLPDVHVSQIRMIQPAQHPRCLSVCVCEDKLYV